MGSKCFKDTVHYVRQVDDEGNPIRRRNRDMESPDKFERRSPEGGQSQAHGLRQRLRWKQQPSAAETETSTMDTSPRIDPPAFPAVSSPRKRDKVKTFAVKAKVTRLFTRPVPNASRAPPAQQRRQPHTFERDPEPPNVPWPTAPPWPSE
eukprot:Gregarina_sp_Pseudo_9__2200@NODE_2543_length_961_cov_64_524946_g2334_i0_p4_GENE_NODE_2543_length_961_cov_64_524946_g2334_i0NODE_2543_length_961_cov_64_524946_g2334_i0_p4_ORF_typecomplete_len150_score42_90_NODE_2543_length_961_cov_64_524946_g2334_i065514